MKRKNRQKKEGRGVEQKYSNEDLIRQVKLCADKLGRTPSSTEFNDCSETASTTTVMGRFGSWGKFIAAANLRPRTGGTRHYSEAKLIRQVRMLAQDLGRTPTAIEFNSDSRTVSVGTVKNYFGTWNNFLTEAGLKISKESYTREILIEQLMTLTNELGRVPTSAEFRSHSETACADTISRFFGNWKVFLESANLRSEVSRKRYSKEVLIGQIQMLAKEIGRAPLAKEFGGYPATASVSTVCVYFGTWAKALQEAGFSVRRCGMR